MRLDGSCHCGAVRFTLESPHPYPFNLCYCSICRKTAGGGGYAINLGGVYETLEVDGREHLRVYQARILAEGETEPRQSRGRRHFCGVCGSPLWLWDPRWPELVHRSRLRSTRRCRCRPSARTCCSTRRRRGWRSARIRRTVCTTATRTSRSPHGTSGSGSSTER